MQVFAVARMSPLILGLTALLLPLPLLLFGVAALGGGPAAAALFGAAAVVAATYAWVFCWMRPGRYELSGSELALVMPLRSIRVPRHDLAEARVHDLSSFRGVYGHTLRVGAGGLFGTFGWLWGPRAGRLDVYVTNLGPWVVVERRAGRPLVLSPADPEAFRAALAAD